MAEELERLAGDLNSLNNTLGMSAIEFKGFTKRLVEAADATTKSGKAWTTFSRFVSGSPIWKIQNKFRATLEVLAGFERRSKENAKAQQEANKRVIEQVQSYKKLEEEMKKITIFDDLVNIVDDESIKQIFEHNEGLELALKNTLAYNKAMLEGNDEIFALQAASEELRNKFEIQKDMYEMAQKQAKLAKKMETDEGRKELVGELKVDAALQRGKASATLGEDLKRDVVGPIKSVLSTVGKALNPVTTIATFFMKREGKQGKLLLKSRMAFLNLAKTVHPIFSLLRRYLIFSLFVFTGAIVLFMLIKNAVGSFDVLFGTFGTLSEQVSYFIDAIIGTVSSFFNMVGAFLSGDYSKALDYLGEMLFSLGEILMRAALIGLQLLVAFVVATFVTGIEIVTKLIRDPELMKRLLKGLLYIGLTLLGLAIAKYVITQLLLIAAVYALPVLIAVAIAGFVTAAAMFIVKGIRKSIFGFANGGVTKGGTVLVGERGPELVNLPKGSRVHSNAESKRMVGGNTINVTINANSLNDNELRRVAQKVGDMINRQVNRSTSSSTMR